MVLLESDKIKINILDVLDKEKTNLSMNLLRKKVGLVNYNSLLRNCEFLSLINFINLERKIIQNRVYYFISITNDGKKYLKIIKEAEE